MSDSPAPYVDDIDTIPPDALLVRRISPEHIDWDGERVDGRLRVTKQGIQLLSPELALKFGCPAPGLSLIALHLADPLDVLIERYHGNNGYGLAYLPTTILRSENERGIQHRPIPDEVGHAVMFRFDGGRNLPNSLRQTLADYATAHWIIEPPPR